MNSINSLKMNSLNWLMIRQDNNTRFYIIKDLRKVYAELGKEKCLYDMNRPVSDQTITEILKFQDSYYKKYKKFSYDIGMIVLGTINWKLDQIKILDGQHRLVSATHLNEEVLGNIVIVNHQTYDEMHETYLFINRAIPVPEIYKTPELAYREIFNEVIKEFGLKFGIIFSESNSPQRPYMNKDQIIIRMYDNETLRDKIDLSNQKESVQLILKIIYNYNNFIKTYEPYQFPIYKSTIQVRKNCLDKAKEKGCFLGMFKDYEWINNMVEFDNVDHNLIKF